LSATDLGESFKPSPECKLPVYPAAGERLRPPIVLIRGYKPATPELERQ
jgi:hypothetical protein